MQLKAKSRLAAALQSLGRYEAALEQWKAILKLDKANVAATKGQTDCQAEVAAKREKEEKAKRQEDQDVEGDNDIDDLDDFFNDVEEAAEALVQEKIQLATAQPAATNAIKTTKKELGTAAQQLERLLCNNYAWYNLNPFRVLDIPHTASKEDIARRYKALSLLLHPDKQRDSTINRDRVQLAYDEVLIAKAVLLGDDVKYQHVKQLVEQGDKRGKSDWEKVGKAEQTAASLEDCQEKAVQRIFAEIEHTRRQVEQREREMHQREQEHEAAQEQKERQSRQHDQQWKQEERVEKRIGNWRDFAKKKKTKI